MKCLICGSEKSEVIMTINHKCLDCGHIFIEGPKDLEKYYNEEYRGKSPLPSESIRKPFLNTILDKVKKVVNLKDKKILEAGCADGFMSAIISKRFEIPKENFLCVDMDKSLTDKAAQRGFKVWNTDVLNLLNVGYDVVFAIDILEHIEDIQKVKEWLKNFKYCVIQLPRARGPKQSFKAHFQTFSDESLNIWLEGFKIIGSWNCEPMTCCFGKSYLRVLENDKVNNI